jgi:hypothetical protein
MKNTIKVAATYSGMLKAELQSSNRIFGGTYIKKNGEVTKFNGRMGVHKFVKGGKSSLKDSNWLIWDTNRKRYMAIIPEQLVSVTAFGNEYEFINE